MINRLLIDYVKKVPIQDIITYYDIKQKRGYVSCPFHDEKTPSAKVYEATNTGYCFGCHKLFDGIELVKKFEKVDFEKAVMFIYKHFTNTIFEAKENKSDISLFCKINDELRDLMSVVWQDKEKRIKVMGLMQTIDMNTENNLLILKLYHNIIGVVHDGQIV